MPRRTRWYLVPLAAGLVALPAQRASAQLVSFGVMAGLSQSTFTGDAVEDAKNAGFIAGAFVRLSALGFAFQPGVYYTAKGAKTSDFSETTGQGSKTTLDYIQIPIVIRLHMGPLYVGGGPALGLNLSCKYSASGVNDADCGDLFGTKSTELTGILEAGVETRHISLGARADIGISNWRDAINSGSTSNLSYKTQTVSLVLAYRF
jgi:hypothetical protein